MRTVIVIVAAVVASAVSVKLPPNFQKCKRKDANFKKCVLEAAQLAIPQLDKPYDDLTIPNLNPFQLTEVTIGSSDGPVNLEQKFTGCSLYGFPALKLNHFEFDFAHKNIKMKGVFPEVRMLCNYVMKGQILVIPVNGEGNSTITLKNLKVTDTLPWEETKKKNKNYLHIKSSAMTMDPELVVYDFQSRKDRGVTDRINPVLNSNWRDIFEEVKPGYVQMLDTIILSVANSFFSKVSLEEAFDD